MTLDRETPVAPAPLDLAVRYGEALAAHLAGREEEAFQMALALGREAVTAQLSVLELAEAHHVALTEGLLEASTPERRAALVQAGAELFRESTSTYEIAPRGHQELREVARLEHEHAERLNALAAASLAISSTLSLEEILQLTADAALRLLGARAAGVTGSDGALPPRVLTAHAPEDGAAVGPAGAALTVTLRGRGRELGSIEVVDEADRTFGPRDEALLAQLGQLASVAMINAELYGRERRIATALQRSLLPGTLPTVEGLSAAVRFSPAGEGIEVGGDFYDVFAAGAGWVAVVGDVCGKGPEAAAVTALARHTLRATAAFEHRPSAALGGLHRALREQNPDGRFLTVAYAHFEVVGDGVRGRLSCGGHPQPLAVRADGRVEPVGRLGTLLGAELEPQLHDVAVHLAPGDTLVFYTDGVTEVRRSRREVFGSEDLTALLGTCAGLPPDAVAERVEAAVLAATGERRRDDIAILVIGPTP